MIEPGGVPDYYGLVAGVRTWRLANTMWAKMGGWLWSASMTDCWRKGTAFKEAECVQGHRIPGEGCMCGIWAFHNVEAFEAEIGPILEHSYVFGTDRFDAAAGIIGAAGDIIDCEYGFRAQFAKPLAIFEDGKAPSKDEIAASYGCHTISPEDYDAFCYEHRLIRLDWE